MAGGIASIGIPRNSTLNYETSIKAGKFMLVIHGTSQDVLKAQHILDHSNTNKMATYVIEQIGVSKEKAALEANSNH